MGADVRLSEAGFDIGFRPSWEEALAEVEARGGKPYPIPAGASDHPLGGHGFARWADEVAAQETELGLFFDTVVVCSVTGSTQAGMIAGFAGQERERSVLGIDGSATVPQTWAQIARIARRTAEAIGLGRPLADSEIVLLDEWHAGTYGIPDAKTIAAIRLCARLEGMLTDPVYEGKSMAALIDLVRDGRIEPGSKSALRPSRRPAGSERLCGRFDRSSAPLPRMARSMGPAGRPVPLDPVNLPHGSLHVSTRYVFVTGGVVSSLGKGITAASLGRLVKARGVKIRRRSSTRTSTSTPGR